MLIMGCTSLSRFASTLKPPQSGGGRYDRFVALTLAQAAPPRDLVGKKRSSPTSASVRYSPSMRVNAHGAQGTIQSP